MKRNTTIAVVFFMVVTLLLRIIDARRFVGGSLNIITIFSHLRHYVMAGEYTVPAYLRYMTWTTEVLCFIYEYIYLRNRIVCKKDDKTNILPIFIYVIISLTGTGRTDLIKVVIGLVAIGFFSYYEVNPNKGISLKTLRKIGLCFMLFGVVFFWIGSIRSKNSIVSKSNPVADTIFNYIGAPLYGLDYQFKHHILEEPPYLGYWTFQEIYDSLGISHSLKPDHNLAAFTTVDTKFSNIYTSLALPYLDYGIVGMLFSRFFLSFIFVLLYKKLKNSRDNEYGRFLGLMLMIDMYYAFFSFGIADRFKDLLLYPPGIIRHTIFLWFIAKFILRLEFVNQSKQILDES